MGAVNVNGWELVSSTHHRVYRAPDRTQYAKVSYGASGDSLITREAAVLAALGRTITPGSVDGRAAFLTPNLGDRVRAWCPSLITSTLTPPGLAPEHLKPVILTGPGWVQDVYEKVRRRRGSHPAQWWDDWCIRTLDSIKPDLLCGDHLIHTDPRLGNWVTRDGQDALLDWETAMLGNPSVFYAVTAFTLLLDEQPRAAATAKARAPSPDAFRAAVRAKMVSNVSWAAWEARRQGVGPMGPVARRMRAGQLLIRGFRTGAGRASRHPSQGATV